MWIRSQDGMSLRQYDGIFINYWKEKEICGDAKFLERDSDEAYFTLGRYESKERALEVLDEIQIRMAEIRLHELLPDRFVSVDDLIYEMPEE